MKKYKKGNKAKILKIDCRHYPYRHCCWMKKYIGKIGFISDIACANDNNIKIFMADIECCFLPWEFRKQDIELIDK
jgi:hypothetical protein